MLLVALGINHTTAPVAVREQVAFAPERIPDALARLRAETDAREAAILSTCNRTEVYCGLPTADATPIIDWLGRYHTLPARTLAPHIYRHPGPGAVRHILRVAAGLDSMMLGEPQILGQVKTAYRQANAAGALGTLLERLFQHTFAVAKQIRTDTAIGTSPVSVAFAAVSLSRQIFDDLGSRTALLVGAGETIELVARHLRDQGIGRIIVANRTLERAHRLAASMEGFAIELSEVDAHLAEADVVITSTASAEALVRAPAVKAALKARRHQPMFMVDLAVPRDIDPAVGRLDDVYLYTVDDLQGIIKDNLRSRREAAEQAEEIIDVRVTEFMTWMQAQHAHAPIKALRSKAERARDEVLERALAQLAQGKPAPEVLAQLAHNLTNKLIHAPSVGLREAARDGEHALLGALSRVYGLTPEREDGDDNT